MERGRLTLLGAFALDAPGASEVMRTRKACALVAYLALHAGRSARREQVASILWPRVAPDAARTSLRQLLAAIRKTAAEGHPLIESEGDSLRLDAELAIDALEFQACAARPDLAAAVTAMQLYGDDLVAEGMSIGSPPFDAWLDGERAALRNMAIGVMERIAAAGLADAIDAARALAATERLARLDPYNEQAWRTAMELLRRSRRRDLAMQRYAALRELLQRDLQIEPEPETVALYEAIRAERGPTPAASEPAAAPVASAQPVAAPAPVAPPRPRRRWWIPAGAVAALVAVVAAVLLLAGPRAVAAPEVKRLFPIVADPKIEQRPALAPDGNRVVYTARLADKTNVDLYLVTIGDAAPLRLTTDPGIDDNAVWTPDGAAIAFTRAARDGASPCRILVMSVPNGTERVAGLCRSALTARLSWAPDGKTLYFSDAETKGGVSRIYRLDTASGAASPVTDPPAAIQGDGEPQVSRDGRTLAYLRTQAWQSVEVETLDLSSGTRRTLTHDGKTIWGLAWSPRDEGLVFSSDRSGDTGLWWIDPRGGEPRRLAASALEYRALSSARARDRLVFETLRDKASFFTVPADATPAVAPAPIEALRTDLFDRFYIENRAGRVAFVSVRSGPEELWVADRGRPPQQITRTGDTFYQEPAWSPDGQWIAYVGVVGGQGDLYLIRGDGSGGRRLTRDASLQQSPMWSADGRFLYYTSRRDGGWRIWRMDPFATTAPVAVSAVGPRTVRPSADRRWLYYALDGVPGVRRRRLGADGLRLTGTEEVVVRDLHPSDWRNWWLAGDALFYARRGGGDPTGVIVRRDLMSGAEREMTDATDLLWSASFWARPDGSLAITRRDLQIDLAGIDF